MKDNFTNSQNYCYNRPLAESETVLVDAAAVCDKVILHPEAITSKAAN